MTESNDPKVIFVRHKFDKDDFPLKDQLLSDLWNHECIALDYLRYKKMREKDDVLMRRFSGYCDRGCIVAASFPDRAQMMIGYIEPTSDIAKYETSVSEYVGEIRQDKFHKIQLRNVKKVAYSEYPILQALSPRQGSVCHWHSGEHIVKAIICGDHRLAKSVKSLTPSQLEVLCFEYLKAKNLLVYLLLPIGRTLKNVDIHGIDLLGKNVIAQVTQSNQKTEINIKIKELEKYDTESVLDKTRLHFFGPLEQKPIRLDSKINYVGVEDVFDYMSKEHSTLVDRMLLINDK